MYRGAGRIHFSYLMYRNSRMLMKRVANLILLLYFFSKNAMEFDPRATFFGVHWCALRSAIFKPALTFVYNEAMDRGAIVIF